MLAYVRSATLPMLAAQWNGLSSRHILILTLYRSILMLLLIAILLPPAHTYCYAHYGRTQYQQDTNHNHNEPCHIHAEYSAGGFTCNKQQHYKNVIKKLFIIQNCKGNIVRKRGREMWYGKAD